MSKATKYSADWVDFDKMVAERLNLTAEYARRYIKGDGGFMALGYDLSFRYVGDKIFVHYEDVEEFVKRVQDWTLTKLLLP